MRSRKFAILLTVTFVSVFSVTACGGGEEEAQEVTQVEQRVEQLEQQVEELQQQVEEQQGLLDQQIRETVEEEQQR